MTGSGPLAARLPKQRVAERGAAVTPVEDRQGAPARGGVEPYALHALAVRAAQRYPRRLAVTGPTGDLTYGELDRRADALAHRMVGSGVRRGDRVVVWAEKGPDAVVAMQAALRIGAAYVPVGETTPVARAALLVRDCGAALVCTTEDRFDRLASELDERIPLLDLEADPDPTPVAPVRRPVNPDDPAYILYTSGSTGVPKGVCVSHRNARAFVDWAVAELAAGPEDRFANHAPFTFDLSVLDLYAPFAVGGTVVLVPTALTFAPEQLVEALSGWGVTVWYSVPSALMLMMRDGGLCDRPAPEALRAVLFAGEPFPIASVRRLAAWAGPRVRLLNLYGPTETNVCTFHEVHPADLARDRPVPIGVACSGDRAWAVLADGTVAGPGERGELLVDGPTVMLGYWGTPAHTGPYRTGDLVEVLADGGFDYLGRVDDMLKVRGHRIEPGEVEAVLTAHPDVTEAAVTATGAGMDAELVAYVCVRPGREVGGAALRRHVARRLPPYMCPVRYRVVAALPRTGNGKVDRAALTGVG